MLAAPFDHASPFYEVSLQSKTTITEAATTTSETASTTIITTTMPITTAITTRSTATAATTTKTSAPSKNPQHRSKQRTPPHLSVYFRPASIVPLARQLCTFHLFGKKMDGFRLVKNAEMAMKTNQPAPPIHGGFAFRRIGIFQGKIEAGVPPRRPRSFDSGRGVNFVLLLQYATLTLTRTRTLTPIQKPIPGIIQAIHSMAHIITTINKTAPA